MKRMLLSALLSVGIHACILWADFGRMEMQPAYRPKPRRVTLMLVSRHEPKAEPAPKPAKSPAPVPAAKQITPIPPPEPAIEPKLGPEAEPVRRPAPEIKTSPQPEKQTASLIMPESLPDPDSRTEPTPGAEKPEAPAFLPVPEIQAGIELKTVEPEQPGSAEPVETSPPQPAIREAKPRYRDSSQPPYPILARKRGYQGTVTLDVFIDKNGRVADIKVSSSSGYAILDKAARDAVANWLFEPGMKGEERIEMWVKVPVRFQLK